MSHLQAPVNLLDGMDFSTGGNSAVSERWHKEYLPEYCVGTVEVFDPETETWAFGPELPNPLCGAGELNMNVTCLFASLPIWPY